MASREIEGTDSGLDNRRTEWRTTVYGRLEKIMRCFRHLLLLFIAVS